MSVYCHFRFAHLGVKNLKQTRTENCDVKKSTLFIKLRDKSHTQKSQLSHTKKHWFGCSVLSFIHFNTGALFLSEYIQRLFDQPNLGPIPIGDMSDHPLVHINEKRTQRDCKYCQIHKIKSKSGLRLKTLFKCAKCNVPLCAAQNTDRHCYVLFHNEFIFGYSHM